MNAIRLRTWLGALLLGLLTVTARAESILFPFQLSFVSGALSGQTAQGSFSLAGTDCPALVCSGLFTPAGPAAGAAGTLLTFAVSVAGTTFSASSDSGYPDFPQITLAGSRLTGIDFLADLGLPSLSLSFASATPNGALVGSGSYIDAMGDVSLVGSVAMVPEPSELALMIGGLGLAAGWRRVSSRQARRSRSSAAA